MPGNLLVAEVFPFSISFSPSSGSHPRRSPLFLPFPCPSPPSRARLQEAFTSDLLLPCLLFLKSEFACSPWRRGTLGRQWWQDFDCKQDEGLRLPSSPSTGLCWGCLSEVGIHRGLWAHSSPEWEGCWALCPGDFIPILGPIGAEVGEG